MHPCSGEMQGLNSNSLLDLSNSSDDFLRQILSSLPSSSWPLNDHNVLFPYPDPNSNNLTSKFQNHQITDITDTDPPPFLPIPLHPSPSPSPVATATDLYNGSLQPPLQHSNSNHHLQPPHQGQSFGASAPSGGGAAAAASVQPKQKARARRGQATDPHSIAERLRRERIAERMKALQELVPNANKTDKASMLDEIIDYVKFLQLQVKVLSMSRLGGAAAVAPMVADASSEGGDDCVQGGRNGNEKCSNDTLAMTEQQVAKLMEEDMGSAMQYLQGKGLCLMPISLATAISTATCHTRNPLMNHPNGGGGDVNVPSSPGISALTVQSTTMGNGGVEPSSVSVSKS